MHRRSLAFFLWLVLGLSFVAPAATRAESPPVPVVLIHGQGGGPDLTWKPAIAYLEQMGYRRGETLFALDLSDTKAAWKHLGLLTDTQAAAAQIRQILHQTGAEQVDVVGHSRGGLIARMLATGDTAPMIRRAVTIDAPHNGALPEAELRQLIQDAGIVLKDPTEATVVEDLIAGSAALRTLKAREEHFADRPVQALAIASIWRPGLPDVLNGHDGAVTLKSQLDWPGARTAVFRLGPDAKQLDAILHSELAAGLLALRSPHMAAVESPEVLKTIVEFLQAPKVMPMRPCDPGCGDWADLTGHWSEKRVKPWLGNPVPYRVGEKGERLFEPDTPMTRAEFTYGLVRALGLPEQLRPSHYADVEGHWATGWIEEAWTAGLIDSAKRFYPDEPITRAEAAALVARSKGLEEDGPEAIAMLQGDGGGDFRPDDPLTMAEGAVLLIRGFR
jgi:pimeloyl-ACP methyl ester carboxylesterase